MSKEPTKVTFTITDVDPDRVEFSWDNLEEQIKYCDDDPEAPVTSSMIIALCVQRMMQANLIQPMALLVCQDLLTEMRKRAAQREERTIVEAKLDGVIDPE